MNQDYSTPLLPIMPMSAFRELLEDIIGKVAATSQTGKNSNTIDDYQLFSLTEAKKLFGCSMPTFNNIRREFQMAPVQHEGYIKFSGREIKRVIDAMQKNRRTR